MLVGKANKILQNLLRELGEDPNEYVRYNVSAVSFSVIFAKSLIERVDRQCGRLLNLMNLWIVAPVAQLDRVADFESEGWRFESSRARFTTSSL